LEERIDGGMLSGTCDPRPSWILYIGLMSPTLWGIKHVDWEPESPSSESGAISGPVAQGDMSA